MYTYSGSLMFPNRMEGMSFLDVAVSLGRVPRFNGHTTQWWPVLGHLMVCYELSRIHNVQDPSLRFYILMHDAHEAVKGDTSRHWKSDSIKAQERLIDEHLYPYWGFSLPDEHERDIIKTIDEISLAAEAFLIAPPGVFSGNHAGEKFEAPDFVTTRLMLAYMKDFYDPNYSNGVLSPGVQKFVTIAKELVKQVRENA